MPEHGSTLTGYSRGGAWSHVEGCDQEWDDDRGALPCMENATFDVIDPAGNTHLMCPGHAIEARIHHAVVTPPNPDAPHAAAATAEGGRDGWIAPSELISMISAPTCTK